MNIDTEKEDPNRIEENLWYVLGHSREREVSQMSVLRYKVYTCKDSFENSKTKGLGKAM